jgi:hypothetical protein
MPQVKAVDSLLKLCVNCIKNSLNLNVPTKTKTKTLQTGKWTGSPWFVEQTTDLGLDKNLFQLRKSNPLRLGVFSLSKNNNLNVILNFFYV